MLHTREKSTNLTFHIGFIYLSSIIICSSFTKHSRITWTNIKQ